MPILESIDTLDILYRPRKFSDMIGQKAVLNIMKGMLKAGKVDRTLMLFGPSGSGKTTLARMFARYVNCTGDKFLCGKCETCLCNVITEHPDVHEFNMASATGKDDVESIVRQATYMPQTNFRIFILDELHQISAASKESLLKPLENPPPKCIWILCTTEPDKFKQTILNRCTKLEIKAVHPKELFVRLKKVAELEKSPIYKEDEILMRIADLVNGEPRSGLKALGKVIHYMRGSGKVDTKIVRSMINEIVDLDYFTRVKEYLLSIYMGNLKLALTKLYAMNNSENFLKSAIEYHNNALFDQVAPSLVDGRFFYTQWVKQKRSMNIKLPNELMALLGVEMVKTLSEIKNYSVQSNTLTIALTCKLVAMVDQSIREKG